MLYLLLTIILTNKVGINLVKTKIKKGMNIIENYI